MQEEELRRVINLKHFLDENVPDSNAIIDYRSLDIQWRKENPLLKSVAETLLGLNKDEIKKAVVSWDPVEFDIYKKTIRSFAEIMKENVPYLKKLIRLSLSLPQVEYKRHLDDGSMQKLELLKKDLDLLNSFHKINYGNYQKYKTNDIIKKIQDMVDNTSNSEYTWIKDELGKVCIGYAFYSRDYDKGIEPTLKYAEGFLNSFLGKRCEIISEYFNDKPTISLPYMALIDKNDSSVLCSIEFQNSPLVDKECINSCELNVLFAKDELFEQLVRKTIIQMIKFKTNMGILTDSYNYICIEIDLEKFGGRNPSQESYDANLETMKEIPLKIIWRDHYSVGPTLKETLIFFLSKAIDNSKMLKKRTGVFDKLGIYLKKTSAEVRKREIEDSFETETNVLFSNKKPRIQSVIPSLRKREINVPKYEFEAVQYGENYNSQLFKFNASYLIENILEPIEGISKILVKSYNPLLADMDFSMFHEYCDLANKEREMYTLLQQDPEFNSIFIKSDSLNLDIWSDGKLYSESRANIFKYIETEVMDPSSFDKYYDKIKRQFEIIHNKGIIHSDIQLANILVSSTEDIYVIGFTRAIKDPPEAEIAAGYEMYQLRDLRKKLGFGNCSRY